MTKIFICNQHELSPGDMRKITTDIGELLVFNRNGDFFVTDDKCTHGTASLSEGDYFDDTVSCPRHWGEFNIMTGEATAPPCRKPLRTYRVLIDGEEIYIDSELEAPNAVSE